MNTRAKGVLQLEAVALLAAIVSLYVQVVPAMIGDWYADENYSHGFLIPFISAYLIWTRKGELLEVVRDAHGKLLGLALCLFAAALLIAGRAGAEFFLQRSSLIFLLIGGALWLWGWGALRVLLFPLLFLFFMIPLPYLIYDAVAFPLKLFAARVATESLLLLGIPVFREGNIIHLASQTLEVADACSGIRSLVSLIALGVVYAYFTETVIWKRIVIVLSTVPIAVVANATRVTGTGILTQYIGPAAAEGFFHTFSGWLVFVAAFVLLMGVGAGLKLVGRRSPPREQES